jgi:hypothetical protein
MDDFSKCAQCDNPAQSLLKKIPILLFSCGHLFHQNCFPKDKEPECHLCIK